MRCYLLMGITFTISEVVWYFIYRILRGKNLKIQDTASFANFDFCFSFTIENWSCDKPIHGTWRLGGWHPWSRAGVLPPPPQRGGGSKTCTLKNTIGKFALPFWTPPGTSMTTSLTPSETPSVQKWLKASRLHKMIWKIPSKISNWLLFLLKNQFKRREIRWDQFKKSIQTAEIRRKEE